MKKQTTVRPSTLTRARGMLPTLLILGFMVLIVGMISAGRNPWDELFINPLINALVILSIAVFGQLGPAIILFTVLLRLVTIPFTIRQLQSTRAMQTASPRMQEIQKKYKDPRRRQEETLKLYREMKINPLGCFVPMAIQMVVFIALYRALVHLVGGSPESLISLSQRLYSLPFLSEAVPLNQHFLWLNLGKADSTFLLPLLVGVTTYLQTRLSQTPTMTAQQQQQQQMMAWMMPLMMVWITLSLPSGTGLYWVTSNIFSVFASYYVYGHSGVSLRNWRQILLPVPTSVPGRAQPSRQEASEAQQEQEEPALSAPSARKARAINGKRRGKRKDRR